MKPSFRYATGDRERLCAADVSSARTLSMFASQELGIEIPIGPKRRSIWYGHLKEEMAVQGWSWGDLAATVVYLRNHRELSLRSAFGLLYYVKEARRYGYMQPPRVDELRVKVSEALATESDEHWVRRLSLATGPALSAVYVQWLGRMDDHEVRG